MSFRLEIIYERKQSYPLNFSDRFDQVMQALDLQWVRSSRPPKRAWRVNSPVSSMQTARIVELRSRLFRSESVAQPSGMSYINMELMGLHIISPVYFPSYYPSLFETEETVCQWWLTGLQSHLSSCSSCPSAPFFFLRFTSYRPCEPFPVI